MGKFLKLKAVALFVCSCMTGISFAANSAAMKNTMATTAEAQNTANDPTLTTDVNAALASYSGTVTTTVKDGVVYLAGQIPSDTDYQSVVTLSESVKGVGDVNVDKLTVKDSANPLYDSYITAKVKGYLIQSDLMGKDIPSWSISVETKDGQVYLSGKIATEKEKQTVIDTVKKVKGVTRVNDKIVVNTAATAPATTTPAVVPASNPDASATPSDEDDDDDDDSSSDDSSDSSSDSDSGEEEDEDEDASDSSKE